MRRSAGFTYIGILFAVAILSAGMAFAGTAWHTAAMREKEKDLLYIGNQYRKAIERYYLSGPAQYPRELSELVRDTRRPRIERYLRKLYPDPITGDSNWGIIKAPDGGIMGVHSLSAGQPLKTANFQLRDAAFVGATQYSDWKFVFSPASSSTARPTKVP